MRIGIDTDDILVDMARSLVSFHNERYGTRVCYEDIRDYALCHAWQCTPEQASERVMEFYETHHFDSLNPLEGAQEAINQLREFHELIVVTSRPGMLREKTERSLAQHFPGCFRSLHFSHNYYGGWEGEGNKGEICVRHRVDLLIEDSVSYAQQCLAQGVPVILMRKPWNEGRTVLGAVVVDTWHEIMQAIDVIHQVPNPSR